MITRLREYLTQVFNTRYPKSTKTTKYLAKRYILEANLSENNVMISPILYMDDQGDTTQTSEQFSLLPTIMDNTPNNTQSSELKNKNFHPMCDSNPWRNEPQDTLEVSVKFASTIPLSLIFLQIYTRISLVFLFMYTLSISLQYTINQVEVSVNN